MPTKVKRYMVPIPEGKEALIKRLAKADGRSVANYIQTILTRKLGEEEQAAYETKNEKSEATDKGSRKSGAGPAVRVSA